MTQTAWITGASSGIGRALALALAAEGWRVIASARSVDKLQSLSREAEGLGGSVLPWPVDVRDEQAVRSAVVGMEQAHGPIDLAVLNAGTYVPDSIENFTVGGFQTHYALNVFGVLHALAALLPQMMARRGGHLVLVSSVAGYRGLPTSLAYGSTKAALINLAEALKLDCDRYGIKLQVVNPGFVKTPLTDLNEFPMPFLLPVTEAARRIAAGLKSKRFEISFPWRFTFWLKVLRLLPYPLYFALLRAATGTVQRPARPSVGSSTGGVPPHQH